MVAECWNLKYRRSLNEKEEGEYLNLIQGIGNLNLLCIVGTPMSNTFPKGNEKSVAAVEKISSYEVEEFDVQKGKTNCRAVCFV